jgi:hypothetical protein
MPDNKPNTPKPEECEFCEFETTDLKAYSNSPFTDNTDTHKWLCKLCAATPAGNACEYPRQYEGELNTLKTICYVGNAILKAIAASAPAASPQKGEPTVPNKKESA